MGEKLTGAARSDALMAAMHANATLIWDPYFKIWVWVRNR